MGKLYLLPYEGGNIKTWTGLPVVELSEFFALDFADELQFSSVQFSSFHVLNPSHEETRELPREER